MPIAECTRGLTSAPLSLCQCIHINLHNLYFLKVMQFNTYTHTQWQLKTKESEEAAVWETLHYNGDYVSVSKRNYVTTDFIIPLIIYFIFLMIIK